MANVLSSAHSILPYGMLLSTVFQACDIDLDGQTDIRVNKPSDAIENGSITWLGYEHKGREWVEKVAHAPATIEKDTDEEAEMDIHPSSPTGALSPPTPPTAGVGSSSAPLDWYQHLTQRLDTISLDMQAQAEENDRQFWELIAQQTEMFQFMRSHFRPSPQ